MEYGVKTQNYRDWAIGKVSYACYPECFLSKNKIKVHSYLESTMKS